MYSCIHLNGNEKPRVYIGARLFRALKFTTEHGGAHDIRNQIAINRVQYTNIKYYKWCQFVTQLQTVIETGLGDIYGILWLCFHLVFSV